ncbi:MAG TPA: RNA polymerase sigma factor [Thermoanaerobaculia bacterium]|nr:RNA polymerase sigma factor [Thermoanaerobaculia bacterium]
MNSLQKAGLSDDEVVTRVRAGETDLFEILMRRYNQRVYRIARTVLPSDAEAEELAQEAWVRAYEHLDQFGGRAAFSTWLIRILLHEGWARARRERRFRELPAEERNEGMTMKHASIEAGPEREALGNEVRSMLEAAIESLPELYRTVFVMREVEELSTSEAAQCLDVTEEVVKTRLHRARAALRKELLAMAGEQARSAYPFLGVRCDRTVERVLGRIRERRAASLEAAAPAN